MASGGATGVEAKIEVEEDDAGAVGLEVVEASMIRAEGANTAEGWEKKWRVDDERNFLAGTENKNTSTGVFGYTRTFIGRQNLSCPCCTDTQHRDCTEIFVLIVEL